MEKRKPTIDEIYKLNVDGLFESTANWFDNAFKKSQAEINRDLYNKINGYSSSSESTGGNVSLGPLLTSLNGSNLYPSRGYLYYNGNDWEFNTPTISGGGGVVDTAAITKIVNDTIKNVSWWGQNINNNKVDGNIVITKGSHSFTIELDNNGNLKFNGNIYATGGITALGVGSTPGSGSGVSLGTLLTKLNSDNPFPTDNGQVLTYDGSNFVWKIPTGSGGSTTGTFYFGAPNKNLSFNGSNDVHLAFGDGLKVEKLNNQIIVSTTGGGTGGSGVTLNPTMSAMNEQLGETTSNTPQFLYWDGSTYTWKNESEISGGSGSSSRINKIKLFNSAGESFKTISLGTADTIGFMAGNNVSLEAVVKEYTNVIKISTTSGGSSSSGTTAGRLRFYKDSSEKSWNGESDFKIIFGSGLNVSWDNTTQITLSATGGSSTGSSVDLSSYLTKTEASTTYAAKSHTHSAADITNFASTVKGITVDNAKNAESVSWLNVTNKPSTFTPSSHTHSTSDINGLSNYVQGVKVNNATNADKATQLANSRTIWGQSFNGTSDINGNLSLGTAGGGPIQLRMNDSNMLDRTGNTLSIGYGIVSNGEIILEANVTNIYTDNRTKHYDFKSNVFDINSNQIHFGSETNGGKIYWDATNNAFRIEGNVYVTGGITAFA